MVSGFYLINYIRTIPVLLICLALKVNEIIEEDLKRNLWYIGSKDIPDNCVAYGNPTVLKKR